jgi:hypothetical protein
MKFSAASTKITVRNKIIFDGHVITVESCVIFAGYVKLPKMVLFLAATVESNPYF